MLGSFYFSLSHKAEIPRALNVFRTLNDLRASKEESKKSILLAVVE